MLNNVQVTKLKNGATVITSRLADAESVSFGIWAAAGGRFEKPAQSGASHFLEHMLFKGTPKRTALQISQSIEGCGGSFNAFTQEESTCYYARTPYEFMPQMVDVLLDMYNHSLFKQREVDHERTVILEEIKMYDDQPAAHCQEIFEQALYNRHPLGAPLAGNAKTLAGLNHDELLSYKEKVYVPASTVFAFAGKLDHAACVAEIEKRYGAVPKRRAPTFAQVTGRTPQETFVCDKREINQSQAVLGFRIFGRHDSRRYALRVLNGILGENMSSRLFQSVREKHGLCYSISSTYQLFEETGLFAVSGGFDQSRALAALALTAKELRRIKDVPVRAPELKRAKDYLLGSFRLGLESSGAQMLFLGETVVDYGRFIPAEETIEGISSVTAEDVQFVANDILAPDRLTLALVVPKAQPETRDQWLGTFSAL